jgi:hypothetical protein
LTAPRLVWIAVRDGKRLGVFASEKGARACAEAKYRSMCEFYGQPVGRTEWRKAPKSRPDVQDLYATHPEWASQPDEYCRADESVIRVEVAP